MNTEFHAVDRYWSHYQAALGAGSHDEMEERIAAFTRALGFEKYGMAMDVSGGEYRFCHNIEGELGTSYRALASEDIRRTEPRVLHARRWLPPVSWNSLGQSSFVLPPDIRAHARRKLLLTGELGLHSGVTLPVRAPGVEWSFITLSATSRVPMRELVSVLISASYFANCIQTSMLRILDRKPSPDVRLGDRAIEILRWSAMGKTSWEISTILMISERTVNFHLQRAAAKLGVKGRRAAVAQALARGLIRL